MRLHVGLVHYPVYNKTGLTIASAVTVTDLHDIARAAKTYGAKQFHVITPLDDQRVIVTRVKEHWTKGYGAQYNRDRKDAMELITVAKSLDDAIMDIKIREDESPTLMATDARSQDRNPVSFEDARRLLREDKVVFLLFGTAWGLVKELIRRADYLLEPILGRSTYNHLSVRSAAAIILDRLAGSPFED
ncbi:MAG: RNA methyltransferase [Desulfobacteraceae bacterium]|jgi:hypothetical protein|nr:MAG: RNA methyltransferase [Desulfobacteraceae bacterium]